MAVTYSTAAKTARMQAVIDQIDAGSGSPDRGVLKIRTSGNVVLVNIPLTKPCGVAAAGVLTFDFDPDIAAVALASGTADNAIIVDTANTTVISGLTVGTAATDVIVDNTSINVGQTVTFTVGTITHA